MKAKYLFVILIVLLLSVIGCVAVYASFYDSPVVAEMSETNVDNSDSNKFNAPEEFEYVLNNGKKLELKLFNTSTTMYDGKRYVYTDKSNKEYSFDKDGYLTSVLYDLSWTDDLFYYENNPIDEDKWISEAKADEISRKHAADVYENGLEKFELISAERQENCIYLLTYKILAGKDNSITGAYAYVQLLYNGKVLMSAIHHEKALERADIEALNKLTINDITEAAIEQAKAIYADDYVGINVGETIVIPGKDCSGLLILCTVDIKTEIAGIGGASETFYYPIS